MEKLHNECVCMGGGWGMCVCLLVYLCVWLGVWEKASLRPPYRNTQKSQS